MPSSVNVGGVWNLAKQPSVKVAGVWQPAKSVWAKVAGVWQKVYEALNAQVSDQFILVGVTGSSTTGRYRLNANGLAEQAQNTTYTTLETWLLAGANSDFEVRATVTSGSLSSGSTGVWEPLSTSREWTRSAGANVSVTVVFTVEIRRASDQVIVDSASISLTVDNT